MPCTLQPWEIEIEERKKNIREYGIDITDANLMTRLLCQASQALEELGWEFTEEHRLWWEGHKKQDAKKAAR